MSHGYAVTNALTGLAGSAFTWSSSYALTREKLNDTLQDELAMGSASVTTSPQTLAFDLGTATALTAVALLNHNLAISSGTVKVEGADNSGFSTNLVTAKAATTVATAEPNNKDSVFQFPSVSRRYWRLTFTHSGNKIISIGELMAITSVTTLSRNKAYGWGETERYAQNRVESRTGHVRATYLSGPVRTKKFKFVDLVGTSERQEILSMWRACRGGLSNLLWIETIDSSASAGSEASQECLWGKLADSITWTEPDFGLYDVDGLELVGQGREVGS